MAKGQHTQYSDRYPSKHVCIYEPPQAERTFLEPRSGFAIFIDAKRQRLAMYGSGDLARKASEDFVTDKYSNQEES